MKIKAGDLQDHENAEVMVSLERLGDTSLWLVDSVSTLALIIRVVSSGAGDVAETDTSDKPTFRN
jgi:hypothetical protein